MEPDTRTSEKESPLLFIQGYVKELMLTLEQLPLEDLVPVMKALEEAHQENRQLFLAGNGGSAATALHMANDLMKGVSQGGRRGFRALALPENISTLTAIANDEDYQEVFAGPLAVLGNPKDLLIVFSGSGNSPNILRAIEVARKIGITAIGFLGMGGGKAASLLDLAVIVPSNAYGPIEDVHLMFDHLITRYFRQLKR